MMVTNTQGKTVYANICAKYKLKKREKSQVQRLMENTILLITDIVLFLKCSSVDLSHGSMDFSSRAGKELEQFNVIFTMHCVFILVFVFYVLFTFGKRQIYCFMLLRKSLSTAGNLVQKKKKGHPLALNCESLNTHCEEISYSHKKYVLGN